LYAAAIVSINCYSTYMGYSLFEESLEMFPKTFKLSDQEQP